MTVNVSILVERAKAFSKKYGVPITKNQFEGTLDDPVPELPYMVWLTIVGNNQAGFTIAFAKDSETVIDAEFKAQPMDKEGTLITYQEEMDVTAASGE